MKCAQRWWAVLAVGLLASGPVLAGGALDAALKDIKAPAFDKRVAAIAVLRKEQDDRAIKALLAAARDKDATVRWAALDALEERADPRAVPVFEAAAKDSSSLVADRARAALAHMGRQGVAGARQKDAVDVAARDASSAGVAGLEALLEKNGTEGLASRKVKLLPDGDPAAGYTVTFVVQSIKESQSGSDTLLDVACTATVMEEPGRQLRFATRVGAALSQAGTLTPADRADLANSAVEAAGRALGEECGDFISRR